MSNRSSSSIRQRNAEVNTDHVSDHSRALALKLSGHMGIENAIQISLENQWYGVVAALKLLRDLPRRVK